MGLADGLGSALEAAGSNHHLLETAHLRAAGLSSRQVTHLVRSGALERIVRGLYRIPGTRSPLQDVAAAISRHRDAAASHTTALYLHDVDGRPPSRPHLTLPHGATGHTSLGILHRSSLVTADLTARHGVPTVTLARAIIDAGEQLSADRLGRVVAEAVARRATSIAEIEAALARSETAPGRVGLGRVRSVLSSWTDALLPDSPAEAAVLRRIVGAGLPTPVTQYEVRTPDGTFVARVDLAWPDRRVAREYDSDRFHPPARVEADELRRQRLEALGWRVDVVHRGHLVPSRDDWLRSLAHDLVDVRRPAV